MAKQVDIDKENEKLDEMQMMKHIQTNKEKKCELDYKDSKTKKGYKRLNTYFERSIL